MPLAANRRTVDRTLKSNDRERMGQQSIFSLGEAARVTGRSKSTLSKAIKNGRLSVRSAEGGQFQIDAAELFRVFPANSGSNVEIERSATPKETPETALLRAKLEAADARLQDARDQIDDLRRRLDAEAEERRRLTALLTDQRRPSAEEAPARPVEGRLARAWSILRGKA